MKIQLCIILNLFSPLCFSGQIPADTHLLQSKIPYHVQLDNVLLEYKSLKEQSSIKQLIGLHNKISDIVIEIHVNREDIKEPLWRKSYKELGVYIGHYGSIAYYDKLLAEAHKINPNSSLRRFTLYSTIFSQYKSHSWSALPNITAANLYLKEFPEGPYAWKVHEALGYFYYDLFKVLRDELLDKKYKQKSEELPVDCYNDYILNKSYPAQYKASGLKATWHFKKSISLFPNIKAIDEINEALKQIAHPELWGGSWYYCAD